MQEIKKIGFSTNPKKIIFLTSFFFNVTIPTQVGFKVVNLPVFGAKATTSIL